MNIDFNEEKYQLDPNRWLNTLPNKKKDEKKSGKKYSLTITLFVLGLILVSVIKNETRNLQKEISNLTASIDVLKFDLYQEKLDHEVISSPENISQLAKKYLESDFISYNKSQIKQLSKNEKILTKLEKTKREKNLKAKSKEIKNKIKIEVAKKIEAKKVELKKLQKLYSSPGELPGEIKVRVAKKIEEKSIEIKRLYTEPHDSIKIGRVGRWVGIQVVKAFFGMPIIPGK